MRLWVMPWLALSLFGCGPRVQQLQDGSLEMKCDSKLAPCTARVGRFCRDRGYAVKEAVEEQSDGKPSSRVVFACAVGDTPEIFKYLSPSPVTPAPPASAAAPAAAPPSRPAQPARVCVPGSTQTCVGPGACSGGQACLPDGKGYGPCECAAKDGG